MSERSNQYLPDAALLEEIELLTELIIAAAASSERMSQDKVDAVLGAGSESSWSQSEWDRPGGKDSFSLPTPRPSGE